MKSCPEFKRHFYKFVINWLILWFTFIILSLFAVYFCVYMFLFFLSFCHLPLCLCGFLPVMCSVCWSALCVSLLMSLSWVSPKEKASHVTGHHFDRQMALKASSAPAYCWPFALTVSALIVLEQRFRPAFCLVLCQENETKRERDKGYTDTGDKNIFLAFRIHGCCFLMKEKQTCERASKSTTQDKVDPRGGLQHNACAVSL